MMYTETYVSGIQKIVTYKSYFTVYHIKYN